VSFQIDLRSLFLIMAAIQAMIFSVLLFERGIRKGRLSDNLLAVFLISLAATLGEHIAGWMGWYDSQVLTFFPFGGSFLYAPLAYLYVKSITNTNYKLSGREWFYFIPALVYFALHFSIWPISVPTKLKLIETIAENQFFLIEGAIDLLVLTIYTVFAVRHYWAYLSWLPSSFSNLPAVSLTWIRNFLIILVVVCLVEWAFGLASLWFDYWYDVRFWDYFIRALLLYYLSIAGYISTHRDDLIFENIQIEEPQNSSAKVASVDNQLIERIKTHMIEARPYLDVELTLNQLAQGLNLPVATVSQAINAGLGKNFNDFVNEYRVFEICSRLKSGEHKSKTLLGVGMDSGFNSKATFNRSFKKVTGLTPKEWVDQHVS
jgi:AraC-like DNA-binding protein